MTMTLRFSTKTVSAALALAAMVACGCQSTRTSSAESAPGPSLPQLIHQTGEPEMMELKQGAVPGVVMTEVRVVELPGVLETTGQVTFDDRYVSSIVSRVQGRIEQTRVSLWDNVRRGEQIALLYSPDFMTAEAEYLQAGETEKASGTSGMSGGVNLADALVSAAKRKLELLGMEDADVAALKDPSPTVWMRAPISGTVVDNKAVRGAAVNPGDVLYSLGTLQDVWITGDIYEDDLARVHVGQQMDAVTTAFPDDVFGGTIERISPNIDANTHTLQIRCEVKNPGLKLKPQMLARVRVTVRPGQALVVPQGALVFDTDSYYAFVESGSDRVERRKVTIGSWSEQGEARIISGLKEGDRVVTGETLQVNALWHEAHGESS
ncbi:MAG TPA: efflux RND transporter periplasmic adaptor subunit [Candidatus Binataceae bacterium]|nr:efflux RND transporter periplasmic adaptor subunit [Candidatus Binataceae bacterium]